MASRFAEKWYAVTFRGTAEMVVWVLADAPESARIRAEDGNYEDATQIEFVKGKPYTMKVRLAPAEDVAAMREP